jgi:hypothetical protein
MYIKTCDRFCMSEVTLLPTSGKQNNVFFQFLEASAFIIFKLNGSFLPYSVFGRDRVVK